MKEQSQPFGLSEREVEILGLMIQGLDTKQISEELKISRRTVRVHRINAKRKTDAKNYAQLGAIAYSVIFNERLKKDIGITLNLQGYINSLSPQSSELVFPHIVGLKIQHPSEDEDEIIFELEGDLIAGL